MARNNRGTSRSTDDGLRGNYIRRRSGSGVGRGASRRGRNTSKSRGRNGG